MMNIRADAICLSPNARLNFCLKKSFTSLVEVIDLSVTQIAGQHLLFTIFGN